MSKFNSADYIDDVHYLSLATAKDIAAYLNFSERTVSDAIKTLPDGQLDHTLLLARLDGKQIRAKRAKANPVSDAVSVEAEVMQTTRMSNYAGQDADAIAEKTLAKFEPALTEIKELVEDGLDTSKFALDVIKAVAKGLSAKAQAVDEAGDNSEWIEANQQIDDVSEKAWEKEIEIDERRRMKKEEALRARVRATEKLKKLQSGNL